MNLISLKKYIIKNLSKFVRNLILIEITGNIGKIVEDEDKIICYVKRMDVKKKDINILLLFML